MYLHLKVLKLHLQEICKNTCEESYNAVLFILLSYGFTYKKYRLRRVIVGITPTRI